MLREKGAPAGAAELVVAIGDVEYGNSKRNREGLVMAGERKNEGHAGLVQASRSASLWMWISAAFDVFPVVAALVVALFMMREGASPAFFVLLFVIGSGVVAILVAAATWKARAGHRIRRGVEMQDGELFASAFVPLRRFLVLVFVTFTISTLVFIAEGC